MDNKISADSSDNLLIEQIAQGIEIAFEILFERYFLYVYRIALRITHDTSQSEDVAQETFLYIWQKAGMYKPERASVRAWVSLITQSRAYDKLKSPAARAAYNLSLENVNEIEVADDFEERLEEVILRDEMSDVYEALGEIPDILRTAIEMFYFGRLTCTEIAGILGENMNTVKERKRRGLFIIRCIITEKREQR